MHADIDRVLITQQQIAERVRALAAQITADLIAPPASADPDAAAAEITIVPILTGAMIFCGDLIRQIPVALRIGLFTVSSYPGRSLASQGTQVVSQQLGDLRGRHVLLLDDVLDSGSTLRLVVPLLQSMQPATLRTCVLLRKDRPAARDVHVDYVGFDIPDEFVVGYGLDFNNYYRNLPDVVTLKEQVLRGRAG